MTNILPTEVWMEILKLHKEREAFSEKIRKIDKTIAEKLGLVPSDKPKKKPNRKELHARCL